MSATPEQIHRLGTVLASTARVVAAERQVITDPGPSVVMVIAADLADMLQALIGERPDGEVDELVAGHLEDIEALVRQLPAIDAPRATATEPGR